MAAQPSTPGRESARSAAVPTTPATSRVAGTHIIQSSPHYTTTRRHALYGTEDRIVIDPGSRIWKVGFSGEGKPRDVFYADGATGDALWGLDRATDPVQRAEEDTILQVKLEARLRSVFHDSLLTDPKSRKVILVEHPFLPLHIKDILARVLFQNLQVPSISFASSHLLSLFASGRITGLVLDSGHHESVAIPIFASRPLYSYIQTTPLAGSRLTSHLRALLLVFGTYIPPPAITGAVNVPAANRTTRIPEEVLTDAIMEEIKTRCCFVGAAMEYSLIEPQPSADDSFEMEVPPSDTTMSESDFSHISSTVSSPPQSDFSVVSNPIQGQRERERQQQENHLQSLSTLYKRYSSATDLQLRIPPASTHQAGPGRATLIIPGWIRERAAEVLFEGGDVDETSVAEVILDALLKVPMDLRKTLASSILIVGGTPMLPGFITRLHAELLRAVSPPQQQGDTPVPSRKYDRYASLRPLIPYIAIMNNPAPPTPTSDRARASAGKAPAFTPATLAWVGGSLAGALKTGGAEVARERWDESELAERDPDESMDISMSPEKPTKMFLPDWTRSPLPGGAPSARPPEAFQSA
ncbi:actin family protein [Pleurotus pulmonarius]